MDVDVLLLVEYCEIGLGGSIDRVEDFDYSTRRGGMRTID